MSIEENQSQGVNPPSDKEERVVKGSREAFEVLIKKLPTGNRC